MVSNVLLVALGAASAVVALNGTEFSIDPSKIDLGTKTSWCDGQYNTCQTLCANSPTADFCDPQTLDYNCLCSNGSAPGLQFYLQSVPTFVCTQAFEDCNLAHVGDASGQRNCTTAIKNKCGTIDPNKAVIGGGGGSSSSSSASGTASPTAGGSGSAQSTSSSRGAAAPTNFQHFGNGAAAVAVGVLAYML